MDKNKNCSVCNIKLDTNNYKKDRTVCKDCYNKKKRKNNLLQQPTTETEMISITIEHYYSVLVFRVKHTLC